MSTIASFRLLQALPTELRWSLTSNAAFANYKRFVSTAAEQEALIEEQEQRHVTRAPAQRDSSAFVPPRLHAFTGSPKFREMLTHASNPLEVLMQELERVASNGRVIATLQICKEIQKRIVFDRRTPSRPDIRVYKALLQVFGSQGYVAECERTVDDMLEAGIGPDTAIYNLWLQAVLVSGASVVPVLDSMLFQQVPFDAYTYQHLVSYYCGRQNLEHALQLVFEAEAASISPTIETYTSVILLACRLQQPKLAHDMLLLVQKQSARKLEPSVMVNVLHVCATEQYTTGLYDLYPNMVNAYKFRPTSEILLAILTNAARLGDPRLAFTALSHLRSSSTLPLKIEEHHMAPLVEALCRDGQLGKAIETINYMRENGVSPVQNTAMPVHEAIILVYQQDPATEEQLASSLNNAYALVTTMYEANPKKVDVIVMNALLSASVKLNDYHRALATYKDLSEVTADIQTYNILLQGCINLRLRTLGESLLSELKLKDLKPDAITYERLIELCVVSPGECRDGLGYMEALTNYGLVPSLNVYIAVGARVGWENDQNALLELCDEVNQAYGRTGENAVRRAADMGKKDRKREDEVRGE